jgi:hypothetical protein
VQSLLVDVLATDFPVVTGIEAEAVVIPASEARRQAILFDGPSGFWTPTSADIKILESRLPQFLDAEALRDKDFRDQISEIRRKLSTYRRQYVGFILDGTKQILLNAFPKSDDLPWKREFIEVSDGGTSFWTVRYDVKKQTLDRLAIHGVAWRKDPSNQSMKPTARLRNNFSVLATTPCRGLSRSR